MRDRSIPIATSRDCFRLLSEFNVRLAIFFSRRHAKIAPTVGFYARLVLLPGVCLLIHHGRPVVHRRARISRMHSTIVTRRLGRWLRYRHLYLRSVRTNAVRAGIALVGKQRVPRAVANFTNRCRNGNLKYAL